MNNKSSSWTSYSYCANRRTGSVADSFATFDESILPGPKLAEINQIHYRHFCTFAKDPTYRMGVYSRSGRRYC